MAKLKIPIIHSPLLKQMQVTSELISKRIEPTLKLGTSTASLFRHSPVSQINTLSEQFGIGRMSLSNISLGTTKLFESSLLKQMQATSELISRRIEPTLKLGTSTASLFARLPVSQSNTLSEQFGIGRMSLSNISLGTTKLFESSSLKQMQATSELISRKIETILKLGTSTASLFGHSPVSQINTLSEQFGIGRMPLSNVSLGTTKLFESSSLQQMQETSRLMKLKIETLELDSGKLDSLASELFENQTLDQIEESIISDSKKNETIEAFFEVFPEIKKMKNALSNNEYIKLTIYLVRYILIYYMAIIGLLNAVDIGESKNYIINGNDVRVRSEPSVENTNSILIKLYNNHYVKKLDEDGNWFKIEFRNKKNELISGWIDSSYLIEIED